jgi:ABC-type multidrug transport system ATPase subunit
VAQAILGEPELLILDEPGNGLDPEQNEHMRALIRELAGSATVILSTHIMQEVDALCDRVLVLSNGRLALDSSLATLRESRQLLLTCSNESRSRLPCSRVCPRSTRSKRCKRRGQAACVTPVACTRARPWIPPPATSAAR